MKNIPLNVETYSLRFLSRNPCIIEYADLNNLFSNADLMIKILKKFPTYFNKINNHKNLNLIEKKINILLLFENILLRPIYKLLNFFLIDTSFIKGKESFVIFKLVYYFISNTVFLYENLTKIFVKNNSYNVNSKKGNQNEQDKMNRALLDQEARLLNKLEILEYEDICIKGEIDINIINEIKNDLESLNKGEIKYFQLDIIYHKYISVCDRIIKFKKLEEKEDCCPVSYLSNVFSTFKSGKSQNKQSLAKIRVKKLISLYKEKVNNTYDDALAMINVFDSMESNEDIDIASVLLKYLFMKLSDNLTDNNMAYYLNLDKTQGTNKTKNAKKKDSMNSDIINMNNPKVIIKPNIPIGKLLKDYLKISKGELEESHNRKRNSEYERAEIKDLNINNFKFQNTYCLDFLNLLFFHDSKRFQGILEENFEKDYDHLFNFLTCDLIFPCILREADKIYELDKLDSLRKALPNEIAFTSIKFLQNLCENHNQNFQKKFFNFDFAKCIQIKKYHYKIISNNFEQSDENQENTNKFSKKFLSTYKYFLNVEEEVGDKDAKKGNPSDNQNVYENNMTDNTQNEDAIGHRKNTVSRLNSNSMLFENKQVNEKSEKPSPIKKLSSDSKNNLSKSQSKEHKRKKFLDLNKKERIRENHELKLLESKRLSFFNFIGNCERILIQNINLDSKSLLYSIKNFKNYKPILNIYQRLSDLIIEMIQGTENKNFENFYKRLPAKLSILNKAKLLNNIEMLDNFIFIKKAFEISYLFIDQDPFEKNLVPIKFNIFLIATNVINQELEDKSIVNILSLIFPADYLIETISQYIRALYIKHILYIDYDDANFKQRFQQMELNLSAYDAIIKKFKANSEIFEDEFFKLASQIFLFLTILGKKYEFPEASKVLLYQKKELKTEICEEQQLKITPFYLRFFSYIKFNFNKLINRNQGYNHLGEEENINKKKTINNINNLIISARFLSKIIYSCEFMIDSPNVEGDELDLKKIYFIIDPRAYLISKNNIDNFFDSVDRTSSTTKIKSLIDILSFFQSEVEYKEKYLKEHSKIYKWLLEIEYKQVDFFNFCMSIIINVIFLIFFRGGPNVENEILNILVSILGLSTIFINCLFLIFFISSKYNFYLSIEISKLENPLEMTSFNKLQLYVFKCFLGNEEIYLMILNIFISLVGIISKKFSFLFAIQLLTVVKFVPTIKEIVIAFKLRIFQLASMIAFLGILIFFYSTFGFYFFHKEFEMELDNGKKANICKSLLECWITYFNLGVRSGGGIGDLLGQKSFSRNQTEYWIRYVSDLAFFITVILLLLNMINGVIVSTFSQIREESNQKEEDINNKCFICNIDRMEFEKRKIDFNWHLKYEHNSKTYIKFFICLNLIHEKDLDADQSFILECIKKRDVYCFPVGKSSSIGAIEILDEENEDNQEEDIEEEDLFEDENE